MDWLKVHLAVNHISVMGMPFLALLLAWGWARRVDVVTRLALWWLLFFAIISIGLKFTGDFAAEQAGAKLDLVRAYVNRHEQSADQATTGIFFVGAAAAAALALGRGRRAIPNWSLATILLIALFTCVLLARTANLGGQIAHPELR